MNKHDYDIGYSNLQSYYNAKDNTTRYDMWWDTLKHLPSSAFEKACKLWIMEGKFFPTLGQIKRMTYDCRSSSDIPVDDSKVVTDAEIALGKELLPLFLDYVDGKTSREEWEGQMHYFAGKHGLMEKMEAAK